MRSITDRVQRSVFYVWYKRVSIMFWRVCKCHKWYSLMFSCNFSCQSFYVRVFRKLKIQHFSDLYSTTRPYCITLRTEKIPLFALPSDSSLIIVLYIAKKIILIDTTVQLVNEVLLYNASCLQFSSVSPSVWQYLHSA